MQMNDLLTTALNNSASDLHLSSGVSPMMRINGELKALDVHPLDQCAVQGLLYDIMSDNQRQQFENRLEIDFSFAMPTLARFRVNAFIENRGMAAAIRIIPLQLPSLKQLGLPPIFNQLCQLSQGLVLISGATGSGKSTTLAALLNHINENNRSHIITIEDPIEFIHANKQSLIHQREVNRDTHGFSTALHSALREDPDVILVGEMRDLETIRLALTAAETGHLVFSTIHTSSAAKTINRIVDVFPGDEKEMIRYMLSESLQAVVSQTLLKKITGGREAAFEIMMGTPAVRNLIRENKISQLYSCIQTGGAMGMQTLDQHLKSLVERQTISSAIAHECAVNKQLFIS